MANKGTVFYNPPRVEVVIYEGDRINLPMYNLKQKIFRNVSNNIEFELLDSDRQPYKIYNRNIAISIINPYNQQLMLYRYLQPLNEQQGIYVLKLCAGDVQEWQAGFYEYSVIFQDPYGNDQLLYTTLAQDVLGTFELIDKPMPAFLPSTLIEIGDWTQVSSATQVVMNSTPQPPYSITSNIPGDAQKGYTDGLQTFSVLVNNFTGTLFLQGTLEGTPLSESSWFDIPINGTSGLTFSDSTGIGYVNFEGNYVWIRFVQVPGVGTTGTGNLGNILKIWFRG